MSDRAETSVHRLMLVVWSMLIITDNRPFVFVKIIYMCKIYECLFTSNVIANVTFVSYICMLKQNTLQLDVNFFFKLLYKTLLNFWVKPYVSRELRRDPSNRRFHEHVEIWFITDTTRNRTRNLFRRKHAPTPLRLGLSDTDFQTPNVDEWNIENALGNEITHCSWDNFSRQLLSSIHNIYCIPIL